jgi:hypothetical protein
MPKFRSIFLTTVGVCVLLSLSASGVNAQMRNPTPQETARARRTGPCRDPWVSIALTYRRLGNYYTGDNTSYIAGVGDYGECNASLYNGGSWSSFDQLYRGVQTALNNMSGNVRISMSSLGGRQFRITYDAGGGYAWSQTVRLIGDAGSTLISSDSASLITDNGGGVVASGGGNFRVQSVGNEKRVNLGRSVLIIRRR